MRFLSKTQCADWCATRGLPAPSHPRIYPSGDRNTRHDFRIPTDSGRRVALGRLLWRASVDLENEERLLWIEGWGVWPSGEHLPLFTALRKAFGEHRNLMEAPGHLSGQGDDQDGLSFLLVGLLFLWDCWLYTETGTVVMSSHDEYGVVFVPSGGSTLHLQEELDRLGVLENREESSGDSSRCAPQ
jgi:hypothetical protein